ncbi:hypothetical protein DPMN_179016 [Dreissena polymorpha]|uniref:TauD/TfdA-like domain-containing protein n=1 Tax=Dreissena polymorpha TaxID=45954 RepID=A0A9D4EED9_DREPO|nr:hypothetical protein DPMN_179016 [Dreissena polymorpha]
MIFTTNTFGGLVDGVKIVELNQNCADQLKQEAFMFRFLLLREQNLTWQDQIRFTELLGTPFMDALSPNRKKHDAVPDPRIGVFSNDHVEGLRLQGTEGWHVDGNVVEKPHMFTLIYCKSSNKNGPTLIVPLKEIFDMLSNDERCYLERIYFVSGINSTIVHPLLYKDGRRNDNTIMLALGRLSGQYLEEQTDGSKREMSMEETQFVQDLIEAKILGSNLIYAHQYKPGDLIVLYNPSVSHIAGPGSQSSREVSGLRLMTRTTVRGENLPSVTSHIKYEFSKMSPFENGYCVFSLKDSVYYPRFGVFDSHEHAGKHCQRLNKHADLAVLPTVEWNDFVRDMHRRPTLAKR